MVKSCLNALLIATLLFPASSVAKPVPFCSRVVDPESFLNAAAQYEEQTHEWDRELFLVFQTKPGRNFVPASMSKISDAFRKKLAVYLYKTGPDVLDEIRKIQTEAQKAPWSTDGFTLTDLLGRIQAAIKSKTKESRVNAFFGRSAINSLSQITRNEMEKSGSAGFRIGLFQSFISDYAADIERYRREYPDGSRFFSDQAVKKAGFNRFALRMISELHGVAPADREAANAISLLHPITDDALDSGMDKAEIMKSMNKISKILNGEPVASENSYETIVFSLIQKILRVYPAEKHPIVLRSLKLLHEAQLQTPNQKVDKIDYDQMLLLSLRKGSLTSELFAYLALGNLSPGQSEYFYKSGAVLQLIDDLLDFKGDLAEGNETIWTHAYRKEKSLERPLRSFLNLQKYFETQGADLLASSANGHQFNQGFNFGFKLFMISTMFYPELAPEVSRVLGKYMPLDRSTLTSVVYSLLDQINSSSPQHRMLVGILDSGFLSGNYELHRETHPWNQENQDFKKPFWQTMKILDKLNSARQASFEFFRTRNSTFRTMAGIFLVGSAVGLVNGDVEAVTNAWKAAGGIVGFGMFIYFVGGLQRPPE